jgi:hypothetical protein
VIVGFWDLSEKLLTTGNTAKLYCLQLIDHAAAEMEGGFRVVDLGCGDGSNFRELLRRRRNVPYIGVEPLRGPAEQARRLLSGAWPIVTSSTRSSGRATSFSNRAKLEAERQLSIGVLDDDGVV